MRRVLTLLLILVSTAATVEVAARLALRSDAFRQRLGQTSAEGRRVVSILETHTLSDGAAQGDRPDTRRLQHHPTLGWSTRPGSYDLGGALATVDAQGHRITPPSSHPFRVVTLGDSFTFGDEVGDTDTYAWRLAELTGVHVTNAGVAGYGLDQLLLQLEAEVLPQRPDVVILGLNSPVLLRSLATWDIWKKPWFDLQGDEPVLHGSPVPPPEVVIARQPRLRLTDLLRIWRDVLTRPLQDEARVAQLNQALLRRAFDAADAAGVRLITAWLPEPDLIADGRDPLGMADAWQTVCAERPHACVDASPGLLAAHAAGVDLRQGAHWSPAGHALVAEALAQHLQTARPE